MSLLASLVGRRKNTSSKELRVKKERLRNHKTEYANIESKVFEVAGGISMDEIHDLQKRVKASLRLKTSRVDWRTKTGIILWFCENWSIISPVIDNYRKKSTIAEHISDESVIESLFGGNCDLIEEFFENNFSNDVLDSFSLI
jgi:hypothetical protein